MRRSPRLHRSEIDLEAMLFFTLELATLIGMAGALVLIVINL